MSPRLELHRFSNMDSWIASASHSLRMPSVRRAEIQSSPSTSRESRLGYHIDSPARQRWRQRAGIQPQKEERSSGTVRDVPFSIQLGRSRVRADNSHGSHKPSSVAVITAGRLAGSFRASGRYWARTNDLHDVNVALLNSKSPVKQGISTT